jgi:hypothetical protein
MGAVSRDGRSAALSVALLATALLAMCGLHAQGQTPGVTVSWAPAHPAQGAAVIVIVTPAAAGELGDVTTVRGTLAGERLRFEQGKDGRFRALGALPVNARASTLVPLTMVLSQGDTVHRVVHLPVSAGGFRTEHLRLPPRFVTPPDALSSQLADERRVLRAALRRAEATPRLWDTTFVMPVGGRVTDAFGVEREVNGVTQSRHLGVDLSGQAGTPVHAANRGIVIVARKLYYQGNAIYIDHGAGLVTEYMHMSRLLVAPGDTVGAGQVIGLVGATGRVTGPHLHWTARFGRVPFNALSLLMPDVQDMVAETR